MRDGGDSNSGAIDEGFVGGESLGNAERGRPGGGLCPRDSSPKPWALVSASLSREEGPCSSGWSRIAADSGVGFSITVPNAAKEPCERRV